MNVLRPLVKSSGVVIGAVGSDRDLIIESGGNCNAFLNRDTPDNYAWSQKHLSVASR